ncbi:MAG: hypothetical protein ABIA93_04940 [Candidatus Woesearchaeota archaeon]
MTDYTTVMLAVIIGVLAAVVYTLRTVVAMDKKIDKLIKHQGLGKP